MKIALEELGYGEVYHFSSAYGDLSHPNLWISALEAKYSSNPNARKFTNNDWDSLLGKYNVSF